MKKLLYLLNVAMVFFLVLGISSCASTQADEAPSDFPEVSEDSAEEASVGADGIAEAEEDAYEENAYYDESDFSDGWGFADADAVQEAEAGTEAGAVPAFDPDAMLLDELKNEAERLRAEAIQDGLDQTMPDEWAVAEEAFTRGMEAYNVSRGEFTQAIESYLGMAFQPSAEGDAVLPSAWRVGTWGDSRDCLWNIAENPVVYGDPFEWRRLYDANRDVLPEPDNPHLILPDMILAIPSISGEYREGTYNPQTGSIE